MDTQSNVYVGVAGYFGKPDHPGKVGLFRRATYGGDWQHVLSGLQVFTVYVHPKDPQTIFAGTSDGVWRSTGRGASLPRPDFPALKRQGWSFLRASAYPKRT